MRLARSVARQADHEVGGAELFDMLSRNLPGCRRLQPTTHLTWGAADVPSFAQTANERIPSSGIRTQAGRLFNS